MSKKLDSISTMTSQLPPETRTKLAALADTSRTTLRSAADKALALPGVGEKIKPVVDELIKKLDTIAGR